MAGQLQINLTAIHHFTGALKAAKTVKDSLNYLYKKIQFGMQAAVGARALHASLEYRVVVYSAVFEHVRERFAAIGIDVRSIGVKHIILADDMKEIRGLVVEAERIAHASMIRRLRRETPHARC